MADYPQHWEADVLLRDGGTAHLRPISDDDEHRLVAFYGRVSAESKYLRFFAPMPRLSERDVRRFTHVDHVDRVALVLTVAEAIIAVGRFDRVPGSDVAEVAFLVQDAHQGRGIGQLLLEHLAQAGREVGVKRFLAEVLPENRRMSTIFTAAGYRVAGGFEDGIMRLEFPILSTDTSINVMLSREHRAEAASIQRFVEARSVAVVGVSRRPDTIGRRVLRNLVEGGYTGRLHVVNPAAESIDGMTAHSSVVDVPDDVELAVVAVPADGVKEVVLDCAAKGVHGMVVVSAGFAETGAEGLRRQRHLVGLARSYGLRLVGPNALGVINTAPESALNASMSPVLPLRGRAGFFCQSGALGVAILETVRRRGLGLSTFVSAGNRADVSGNDLLQYWEEDEATEVVLLYLESVGNPRKFSRIARRVSRRKPVIAVRSGRSTQGVPMGERRGGASAPPAAVDAMFRQAGVISVDTLDEMFDVAQLLAHQPLPRGPRLAVVGNSHALGLLATDAATAVGLHAREPVSLGADATAEEFTAALSAALGDSEVDSIVVVFLPPLESPGDKVAEALASLGRASDKPVVSTFLAAVGVPEPLRVPEAGGGAAGRGSVPSYPAPEAAVRAIAKAVEYAAWLDRPQGDAHHADSDKDSDKDIDKDIEDVVDEVDVTGAKRLVEAILADAAAGRDLTFEELRDLLDAYGVELWERIDAGSAEAAVAAGDKLGWNVALKATAPHLRHRPDLAHVWRNIDDEPEMRHAWATLHDLVDEPATAGFVVQRVAAPGVPVVVTGIEDPLFGPVVSFGVSGLASDLLEDRSYRVPPMHAGDAADMVREIRAAPLLFGYRGAERVDVGAVEDLLVRVAHLKHDLPQVRSLELDLVLAGAHGASVLTASATLAPPASATRSDWYARRMA